MQLSGVPQAYITLKKDVAELRKQGAMEHQIEEKLAKSTQTQKEWRLKQVSTST
jgi:hypothetical protein